MRPCARPPQAATTGARQAVGTKVEEEYVEEDFYALLGVVSARTRTRSVACPPTNPFCT